MNATDLTAILGVFAALCGAFIPYVIERKKRLDLQRAKDQSDALGEKELRQADWVSFTKMLQEQNNQMAAQLASQREDYERRLTAAQDRISKLEQQVEVLQDIIRKAR